MHIASLHVYPVKSLGSLSPDSLWFDPWGPRGDRRWLVVDLDGMFLTQRAHPRMATVQVSSRPDGGLTFHHADRPALDVTPRSGLPRPVRVWRSDVMAQDAGDAAAVWLERVLERPCRLVHMDEPAQARPGSWEGDDYHVSFADGFPVLVCTTGSLADLNGRLKHPVPMSRFRPNLVVEGAGAWAEDGWRRLRIGEVELKLVKPCSRCVVTTVDQNSGEIPDRREPLRTLAGFRQRPGGVMFGQNALVEKTGCVRVGDRVEVMERSAL